MRFLLPFFADYPKKIIKTSDFTDLDLRFISFKFEKFTL
jgi:hypothetical protein